LSIGILYICPVTDTNEIMKTKIKSVKGLKIGQVFNVEGVNYLVTHFPTRYSVHGKNQKPEVNEPSDIKTSLRTKTLFYQHCKTDKFISNN